MVSNGQKANATTFNTAFLSKQAGGDTTGVVGLKNTTNPQSGAEINNAQRAINELFDADGTLGEGDSGRKDYTSTNFIQNGDNRKTAITRLDAQLGITNDLALAAEASIETRIAASEKGSPNGVATLDSTGKIPTGQMPDASINALVDVDTATTPPTLGQALVWNDTLSQWVPGTVSGGVTSVNSQSGAVVLDADDISEGATNRYYTDARANARIAASSINALSDVDTATNPPVTNQLLRYNGTNWVPASVTGGSKNYVPNGDFETGSVGSWVLGNVTLTSAFPSGAPTFGSGAAAQLSGAITTTNPLESLNSLQYASTVATTAGNFLSSPVFTIDREDRAKVLTFSFSYELISGTINASGTSSNSFGVAIYDVTNSAWVQPTGVWNIVQTIGVGISTGTFQTASNASQYRLVLYNANATSGGFTLNVDDFVVGPQSVVVTGPVVDLGTETWEDNQTNATTSVRLARIGNRLFADGTVTFTGAQSGAFLITVPSAYTIDSFYNSTSQPEVGTAILLDNGSATIYGVVRRSGSNQLAVQAVQASSTYGQPVALTSSVPFTWASTDIISFSASWVVAGWATTSVMSSDTDTRVITARAVRSANQTGVNPNNSSIKINFDSAQVDDAGAFSTANNRYVAPVTGKYQINAVVGLLSTNVLNNLYQAVIFKNGSFYSAGAGVYPTAANAAALSVADIVPLNAGDFVEIYLYGAGNNSSSTLTVVGGTSSTTSSYFSVSRISGPATVAATETVVARYSTDSGSFTNAAAQVVNFSSRSFDSHSAVATGSSWRFTAPVRGSFLISAKVTFANASFSANTNTRIFLFKNGTAHATLGTTAQSSTNSQTPGPNGSDIVQLNAGDYIDIRVNHDESSSRSLISDSNYNYVSIARIGN